jgi:hypothetical protein
MEFKAREASDLRCYLATFRYRYVVLLFSFS